MRCEVQQPPLLVFFFLAALSGRRMHVCLCVQSVACLRAVRPASGNGVDTLRDPHSSLAAPPRPSVYPHTYLEQVFWKKDTKSKTENTNIRYGTPREHSGQYVTFSGARRPSGKKRVVPLEYFMTPQAARKTRLERRIPRRDLLCSFCFLLFLLCWDRLLPCGGPFSIPKGGLVLRWDAAAPPKGARCKQRVSAHGGGGGPAER